MSVFLIFNATNLAVNFVGVYSYVFTDHKL